MAGLVLLCGLLPLAGRGEGRPLPDEAVRTNRRGALFVPPASTRLFPGQEVTLTATLDRPPASSAQWLTLLVRGGDVSPRLLAMASNSGAGGGGADTLSVSFLVPAGRAVQVFASYRAEEGHAVVCREAYRIAPLEDLRELRGMDAAARESLGDFLSGCIQRVNRQDAEGLIRLLHPEMTRWLSGMGSREEVLLRAFGARLLPIPDLRSVAYRSVANEDVSGPLHADGSTWPVRPEVEATVEFPVPLESNEAFSVYAARWDGEWRLVLPVQDRDSLR